MIDIVKVFAVTLFLCGVIAMVPDWARLRVQEMNRAQAPAPACATTSFEVDLWRRRHPEPLGI